MSAGEGYGEGVHDPLTRAIAMTVEHRELRRQPGRGYGKGRRARRPMSLQVERFEERLLLATFLVNDTADTVSGAGTTGTLRYVLGQLSALNQPTNEIDFQLGGTGAQTITLGSDLPSIANPVTVDGYKLNGPANTAAGGTNASILVQLDLGGHAGLVFATGSLNSVVKGLSIYNGSAAGITVQDNGVSVVGDFLGVKADGLTTVPNALGVSVASGVTGSVIGTSALADRNLISGNTLSGVDVAGGATIRGNLIGTDKTGLAAAANGTGVSLAGSNSVVGGAGAGDGNTVAFNATAIMVDTGSGNTISRNAIFQNVTGITLTNGGNHNLSSPSSLVVTSFLNLTTIEGTFNTPSAGNYTLEFFSSAVGDPTATAGQAHVFLGQKVVSFAAGLQPFQAGFSTLVPAGQVVTATATSTAGDTSAFAPQASLTNPFLVFTTIDSGIGSLRQAIADANMNPDANTITFAIPTSDPNYNAGTNTWTIKPSSALPPVIAPVTIDGTTPAQFIGIPVIQLDGSTAGAVADGFDFVSGSSGSRVRSLAVYKFSGAGLHVQSNSNAFQANYLGTDASGAQSGEGNGTGIWIDAAAGNVVGGLSGLGNVISGNTQDGVLIQGDTSTANVFLGNKIGTDATGASGLPNLRDGLRIVATSPGQLVNDTIGGNANGAGNTIAFNARAAVTVDTATGVSISRNSIFRNASGIVLSNGGNQSLPAPTLTLVNSAGGNTQVNGQLTGAPAGSGYTIEFFASAANDLPTSVYARTFIGSVTLAPGITAINATLPVSLAAGQQVVATATSTSAPLETSPFSNSAAIANPFLVTNTADSGPGSFRQAIQNANASTGTTDTISFAIGSGLATITLASALPPLTNPAVIDGTTQPGYSGTALILISGAGLPGTPDGIALGLGSDATTVRGLSITGFAGAGLRIASSNDVIQGNIIGASGIPNGQGILVTGNNTRIGGSGAGAANTIAFNTGAGVTVNGGTGDTISQNAIFRNGGAGIVIPAGTFVPPLLAAATAVAGQTTIQGGIGGAGYVANAPYTVEFFASAVGDPSTGDQARTFLGTTTVNTDASGNGAINFTSTVTVPQGQRITATATAPGGTTSAFAGAVSVANPFIVNTTADSGVGSLRSAISNALANPGINTIVFAIPLPGPFTIHLASALPPVSGSLIIDGTTEPGFGTGNVVTLDGSLLGGGADGILLNGTGANTVKGLSFVNFAGAGLRVQSSNNVIQNNTISLNKGAGVRLDSGSGNAISKNAIFGNGGGIALAGGANGNQASPSGLSFTTIAGRTQIEGTVTGLVAGNYTVEIFIGRAPDVSSPIYASTYLATSTVTLAAAGSANFALTLPAGIPSSQVIYATVTSPFSAAAPLGNDTSAFGVSVAAANPYVVTNNADSGVGSLREAILNADAVIPPGPITFTGAFVIVPKTALPAITQKVTIDATSAAGVQIDGQGLAADGLVLAPGSDGSTIQGLNVHGFAGAGIHIRSNNNLIFGDTLGTNVTATLPGPGNQFGVVIDNAGGNIIGGTGSGQANVIGSNSVVGIQVQGSSAVNNVISGNFIGTNNVTPISVNLGNATYGVFFTGGASNNVVGGGTAAEGNTFAFNAYSGVFVQQGVGNRILSDTYGSNGGTGSLDIDLATGVVATKAPILLSALNSGGNTIVTYQLTGAPGSSIRVQFYNDQNSGKLRTYLPLAGEVVTLATVTQSFKVTIPGVLASLVATATNTADGTSRFSNTATSSDQLFVVNTDDSGPGSLRQSLLDAKAAGIKLIRFQIQSDGAAPPFYVINLQTPLVVDFAVTIDGFSQSDFLNTNSTNPVARIPRVVIDGSALPGTPNTPALNASMIIQANGSGSTVEGLIFNRQTDPSLNNIVDSAILILGNDNILSGDIIGMVAVGAPSPTQKVGYVHGVHIAGASRNKIGDDTADFLRTLIDGNSSDAILVGAGLDRIAAPSTSNLIQNSVIGTTLDGTSSDTFLANGGAGVHFTGGSRNAIGAGSVLSQVLIAGNAGAGVVIDGGATQSHIQNTFIGTDIRGTKAIANGLDGVLIADSSNNFVGDPLMPLNLIGANGGNGVHVAGSASDTNTISNSDIGISLLFVSGKQNLGNQLDGVRIEDASNSVIGLPGKGLNVISGNGLNGIHLTGSAHGTKVQYNNIGTDATGQLSNLGNSGNGILIDTKATNNTIGLDPSVAGSRAFANLISGNQKSGVSIQSRPDRLLGTYNNIVIGNRIGTSADKSINIGNQGSGVEIVDSPANLIGSTTATVNGGATANLIRGNTGYGVVISGPSTSTVTPPLKGNTVQGNTIGSETLTSPIPGNFGGGVAMINTGGAIVDVGGTKINVAATVTQNLILGNVNDGVVISYDAGATTKGNNTVSGNVISRNIGRGVHLVNSTGAATPGTDTIVSNFIGTDSTGTSTFNKGVLGNRLDGVLLEGFAATVTGNTISGNGISGIHVESYHSNQTSPPPPPPFRNLTGTMILGNKIGVNKSGSSAYGQSQFDAGGNPIGRSDFPLGNVLDGVLLEDVFGAQVGSAASPNVISGNLGRGIEVRSTNTNQVPGATANTISNNVIGLDLTGFLESDGTHLLGNIGDGIFLFNALPTNIIANTISGNRGFGIHVTNGNSALFGSNPLTIQGNSIGVSTDGNAVTDSHGQSLGNGSDGVFLDGVKANASITKNVISGNRSNGIDLLGSMYVVVTSNKIGTKKDGLHAPVDFGNSANGINLNGSSLNFIGGTSINGNIISGNQASGVFLSGSNSNFIGGNFIGVDAGGKTALANKVSGVVLSDSINNVVGFARGGSLSFDGNVISGNNLYGIQITGANAVNSILGNVIGLGSDGTSIVSNTSDGIFLNNVSNQLIGGLGDSQRNVISGNAGNGVRIFGATSNANLLVNNYIGLSGDGQAARANQAVGVLVDNTNASNVNVPTGGKGATVSGKINYIVNNVISGNGQSGILLFSSDSVTSPARTNFSGGTTVAGNRIGTNAAGTSMVANGGDGVAIVGSSGNLLGPAVVTIGVQSYAIPGNLISGNAQAGVLIFSPAESSPANWNRLAGNKIGTDATGEHALGNRGDGVDVLNGSGNLIGDLNGSGFYNVISGNNLNGVYLDIFPSRIDTFTPNYIDGNLIGTDAKGTQPLMDGTKVLSQRNGVLVNNGPRAPDGTSPTEVFIGNVSPHLSPTGKSIPASLPRNVIVTSSEAGIQFAGRTSGNAIQGNYLGVNAGGVGAPNLGNTYDIYVNNLGFFDSHNLIGGTNPGAGNIIGGNKVLNPTGQGVDSKVGIFLSGPQASNNVGGNAIQGNRIGLDIVGGLAGSAIGILVKDSSDNVIGGDTVAARNVISGNTDVGVQLSGIASHDNKVFGNFIGTNPDGTGVPRGLSQKTDHLNRFQQYGVLGDGSTGNIIGLGDARNVLNAFGNVISGNIDGVLLTGTGDTVTGNLIGLAVNGTTAVPNFQIGIDINDSASNVVNRNVVSANGISGVNISGATSSKNQVFGNYVGTNFQGAATFVFTTQPPTTVATNISKYSIFLGGQRNGISIVGSSNNQIGHGDGNLISGNIEVGLYVSQPDFTGLRYAAPRDTMIENNTVTGNGIYGVLFYDAPNNTLNGTPTAPNTVTGNPTNFLNYLTSINGQTPTTAVHSVLLPPVSTGPAPKGPRSRKTATTVAASSPPNNVTGRPKGPASFEPGTKTVVIKTRKV